jgi:hypothetical protein
MNGVKVADDVRTGLWTLMKLNSVCTSVRLALAFPSHPAQVITHLVHRVLATLDAGNIPQGHLASKCRT